MCSFPRINRVYACENPYVLGALKTEWRFDGTIGPDFPDAQRSIGPAFLADSIAASCPRLPTAHRFPRLRVKIASACWWKAANSPSPAWMT